MSATRKNIIFREAARLFRQKGYAGSSLRELAAKAGIQGGSVYHHFSSKQEILFLIMDYTMTNLLEKVQREISQAETPLEQLQRAITFHIRYHTEDRDETYVTDAEMRSLEPANYQRIERKRNQYEHLFRQVLLAGADDGSMRVADAALAARALLQMCTGVSYWYSPGGAYSIESIAEQYVALFVWGVCGAAVREKTDVSTD